MNDHVPEVIDIINKFFEDNPNAEFFEIKKGALSGMLDIGTNKIQQVIDILESMSVAFHNSRGKLKVDGDDFYEFVDKWNKLNQAKTEAKQAEDYARGRSVGVDNEIRRLQSYRNVIISSEQAKDREIERLEKETEYPEESESEEEESEIVEEEKYELIDGKYVKV
jgi:hypothetical protein